MSRVWVTGYDGFMGPHLVDLIEKNDTEVLASFLHPAAETRHVGSHFRATDCDTRDYNRVEQLLSEFRPDKIFHLAAHSYPTVSWEYPRDTFETNVNGTINIFEGVKKLNLDSVILNACSSAEYGLVREDEVPVTEDHGLQPLHPYGVSKVAQEMIGYQYHKNFNIKSVAVRIFNTTGPGKVNDVCSDFTRRLIEQEKRGDIVKTLKVGNLDARRAITDVRDVVSAFDLALEKAVIGEAYNLSGESVYAVRDIVTLLQELVGFEFEVVQDRSLLRPTDEPIIFGSSEKFRSVTDWTPKIQLRDTLRDMLSHWRSVL